MLKTKVILSSVTNLSDARYAAGMGVDYIGYSINPESSSYVTLEQAKMISNWLSGVSFIGDIDNALIVNRDDYATDYIQTNNFELIDELEEPIVTIDLEAWQDEAFVALLEELSKKVSFFILKMPADQLTNLKPQLTKICGKVPVFISTDFDAQNIEVVVNEINPRGIVLYGSNEVKPGFSSYDGIADILELLEVD